MSIVRKDYEPNNQATRIERPKATGDRKLTLGVFNNRPLAEKICECAQGYLNSGLLKDYATIDVVNCKKIKGAITNLCTSTGFASRDIVPNEPSDSKSDFVLLAPEFRGADKKFFDKLQSPSGFLSAIFARVNKFLPIKMTDQDCEETLGKGYSGSKNGPPGPFEAVTTNPENYREDTFAPTLFRFIDSAFTL